MKPLPKAPLQAPHKPPKSPPSGPPSGPPSRGSTSTAATADFDGSAYAAAERARVNSAEPRVNSGASRLNSGAIWRANSLEAGDLTKTGTSEKETARSDKGNEEEDKLKGRRVWRDSPLSEEEEEDEEGEGD